MRRAILMSAALLASCGGGSDGGGGTGSNGSSGGGSSQTQSYTVGGSVSGLSGAGLVLQDNGVDDLALQSSGSFAFPTSIASGALYSVTVKTQPSNPWQTCVFGNPSGTVSSNNITNVSLTCTTNVYGVGGSINGMSGSGLVLQDNSGDDLSVSANGSFEFATSVDSGNPFNVTVKTQPTAPIQVCAVTNAAGTVASAGIANVAVSCGPLALLAGAVGGPGSSDGQGVNARFNNPFSVATDSAGNIYVADNYNETIRKITPTGLVSTLAGTAGLSGATDGTGSGARFAGPAGVAVDSAGNVYVADAGNYTIRKITAAGVTSTFAGTAQQYGSADGTASAARFSFPYGLALDVAGNLYVADTSNQTIRKITPAGAVSTLAGTAGQSGAADGNGSAAKFNFPQGIAVDPSGVVYVADTANDTIRKITPAGMVTTLAGSAAHPGTADGTGAAAAFNLPMGLVTDPAGNLYVADSSGNTVRKVTPAGVVTTLAGTAGQHGFMDGTGGAARFGFPQGITIDPAGSLYVADTINTIRKISTAAVVTTLAGVAAQTGSIDGAGGIARFNSLHGITTDSAGNAYVADGANQTIRKITRGAVVSTFAGVAASGGFPGSNSVFNLPNGVASDSAGNLYVADTNNAAIRKITPAGVVSTLAGANNGTSGSADGTGAAAQFKNPTAIAADSTGTVYVADTGNLTIRKITAAGVVTTLAGTAGSAGSADGNISQFGSPSGLAIDTAGNVYVADAGNQTIRRITPAGIVSTVAGATGQTGSADGAGSVARFNNPSGLAIDSSGNIYIADGNNDTIRKMTPNGVVTTVVGTPGSAGVSLGPLPGSLDLPRYLAVLAGPGVTLLETDAENGVLQITLQ
jgi:sugar lactone lactonase YvrE